MHFGEMDTLHSTRSRCCNSMSNLMLKTTLLILLLIHFTFSQVVIVRNHDSNYTLADLKKELMSPTTVNIDCFSSKMCITVSKTWLRLRWKTNRPENLILIQPCDHTRSANQTHVTLCTEAYQLSSCGTAFTVINVKLKPMWPSWKTMLDALAMSWYKNDSHVIYSNEITVKNERLINETTGQSQGRKLPWSCVYPLQMLVGVQLTPLISPIAEFLGETTGSGKFQAAMLLYKTADYREIYESTPLLQMDDRLRVRIQLIKGPRSSKLQIFKCWGSPHPIENTDEVPTYELINQYCPSKIANEADVSVLTNGEERHATFESHVFRFNSYPNVYLHCQVKLCFAASKCAKMCEKYADSGTRSRRETDTASAVLSLGPMKLESNVSAIDSSVAFRPATRIKATPPEDVAEEDEYILGLPRSAVYVMIGVLVVFSVAVVASAIFCFVIQSRTRKLVMNPLAYEHRLHQRNEAVRAISATQHNVSVTTT